MCGCRSENQIVEQFPFQEKGNYLPSEMSVKRKHHFPDRGVQEGEMYGKSNMGTYITTCKVDQQWKFAV